MERIKLRVDRYLRVSRLDQHPCLQEDETVAFIERRGWILADTLIDHGASGSREKRPELDRRLLDTKKGKFDTLLVWRNDRPFRSMRHMVNALAELSACGVCFASVTEPFDGTTPQGKLSMHLISGFSEFESGLPRAATRWLDAQARDLRSAATRLQRGT